MPKFKAWLGMPSGQSLRVVVELDEYQNSFDARRAIEAQYPGARIINLTEYEDPGERAAERQEEQKAVAAGGAGLLLLAFGAIWFAPLLALFGALGYWEWTLTGT